MEQDKKGRMLLPLHASAGEELYANYTFYILYLFVRSWAHHWKLPERVHLPDSKGHFRRIRTVSLPKMRQHDSRVR